jgi:hypothetical protein
MRGLGTRQQNMASDGANDQSVLNTADVCGYSFDGGNLPLSRLMPYFSSTYTTKRPKLTKALPTFP